uniref:Family with sequence similarity 50 member A n=1 Tax=Cyprinus carpio carpio TaxID=630221 RepID=A0A8C1AYX3_CYPCA
MAQYKGAASEAGRAMQLRKKREREREQLEQLKQKIAEDNMVKSNIDKKFSAHYDAVEQELKSSTVGLVTLNDMKAKQEALVKEREKQLAKKEQSKELQLHTWKEEKTREEPRCGYQFPARQGQRGRRKSFKRGTPAGVGKKTREDQK